MVLDATHYLDGRPTASHTYYSLHGDWRRKKVFRFGIGSAYGSGNFQRPNVDAFDLRSRDWDSRTSWPEVPEAISYAKSQVQHPSTGDVYVVGNTRLWRFSQSLGTWLSLAALPPNGSATYGRAAVIDTVRNRLVVLGNDYRQPLGILVYDLVANAWANNSVLTGPSAPLVSSVLANAGHHNLGIDKYIVKTASAGEVLTVDPITYAVDRLITQGAASVPAAVNGVFGKFASIPALGGYVYQPSGSAKLWFLAGST